LKPTALALMGGKILLCLVFSTRHKRLEGQQEIAPSFDYAQDDKKIEQNNKLKYLK